MSVIPSYKTIVYASDLGDNTRPVFRHAVSLAQHYSARIVMLHVVKPLGSTGQALIDAYLPQQEKQRIEQDGLQGVLAKMKQRLQKFCEEEGGACNLASDIVSTVKVVHGHPAEQIVRVAEEHNADLIVMGTCRKAVFGGSDMGSTARQVSLHSRIPLMTVPNC